MAGIQVSYKREGEKHIIDTGNAAIGNIVINTEGIPAEERNGTAKQLLCSSALFCYCSALVSAMDARGMKYKNISAVANLTAGNNDNNVSRVLEIELDVKVEIDEDDYDTFERIKKVMRNGCLVTSSLHDGIEMKYNLDAISEDD